MLKSIIKIAFNLFTKMFHHSKIVLGTIVRKLSAIDYLKEIIIVSLFILLLFVLSGYMEYNYWLYAAYISIGILSSQFYNIYIYKSLGATDLMTWFKSLGLSSRLPSMRFIVDICLLYFIALFFFITFYLNKAVLLSSIDFLQIGFIVAVIICFISQLIFSSVMRFTYELSFCVIVLFAIIINNIFLGVQLNNYEFVQTNYKELWDLLIFVIPIFIGFPIVIGGAGFITSFYAEEKSILRKQLYRHILMSLYFEFGAIYFIVIPILKEMIIIKEYLKTA